jgi:hypothetical protein
VLLPGETGTVARISVADDLGFRLKVGVTKKHTQAVETLADALAEALPAGPGGAGGVCPFGHPAAAGARYCPACGAAVAATA